MPNLIYFLAAEKVIIDKDEPTSSVISLLDRWVAEIPRDDLKPDGVTPKSSGLLPFAWWVTALWEATPSDKGKEFEQRWALFGPRRAKPLAESATPFQFATNKHRVNVKALGFPVTGSGDYRIRLWIRERLVGAPDWGPWRRVGAGYPVQISFQAAEE